MSRLFLAAAAAALLLSGAAMAQYGDPQDSMTCQDLIDKANTSVNSIADETKKENALREISRAKSSLLAHDEPTCKDHAQKALDLM